MRFEELKILDRVFQPTIEEVYKKDFHLKGKWKQNVFFNNNPMILELGCGKGEYSLGLARKFPQKNFVGIDIKGARIWIGAKESNIDNIRNSAFLRTRIELINSFFDEEEVDEIWLTFPDPQIKNRRKKKRLTSISFLTNYQKFLRNMGIIHLKTDSESLYSYTLSLLEYNKLKILIQTDDLYNSEVQDDILEIKTFYEKQYLKEGKKINYLKFLLPKNLVIQEPPDEKE